MKKALHPMIQKITFWLPCLWMASIPLGPSVQSVFLVLTLASLFLNPNDFKQLRYFSKQKWFIFLILAISFSLLSLIWSKANYHDANFYLKKNLGLLLIPLLTLTIKDERQINLAFKGFLVSSLVVAMVALSVKLFGKPIIHDDLDPGHIFYNHIITGFYAAFASFLSLQFLFAEKKAIYLLGFLIFSLHCLFINTGRFGYALYFALLGFSFLMNLPKKYILFSIFLGVIVLMIGVYFSPVIHSGIKSLLKDFQLYQQGNKDSSLGFRLQFHRFAIQQFLHHPLIGNGIGGYDALFKQMMPVPAWTYQPNTHSQYLLFACDLGIIGLCFWAGFFYYLNQELKAPSHQAIIFYGFMLALGLNFFTDNLLFASPGHLLMAMIIFIYAPLMRKNHVISHYHHQK